MKWPRPASFQHLNTSSPTECFIMLFIPWYRMYRFLLILFKVKRKPCLHHSWLRKLHSLHRVILWRLSTSQALTTSNHIKSMPTGFKCQVSLGPAHFQGDQQGVHVANCLEAKPKAVEIRPENYINSYTSNAEPQKQQLGLGLPKIFKNMKDVPKTSENTHLTPITNAGTLQNVKHTKYIQIQDTEACPVSCLRPMIRWREATAATRLAEAHGDWQIRTPCDNRTSVNISCNFAGAFLWSLWVYTYCEIALLQDSGFLTCCPTFRRGKIDPCRDDAKDDAKDQKLMAQMTLLGGLWANALLLGSRLQRGAGHLRPDLSNYVNVGDSLLSLQQEVHHYNAGIQSEDHRSSFVWLGVQPQARCWKGQTHHPDHVQKLSRAVLGWS